MGRFPREVLNELKWHPEKSLEGVIVKYSHRGLPNDTAVVKGEEIVKLERSFFVIKRKGEEQETWIPYHRIREIRKDKEVLWKKEVNAQTS